MDKLTSGTFQDLEEREKGTWRSQNIEENSTSEGEEEGRGGRPSRR